MAQYDLTWISLGAGVQSTAVYVMSVLGIHGCPKADAAIFADTQAEPAWVYEQLDLLEKWGNGRIPIHRVTEGNLMQDFLDRHSGKKKRCAAIPAFTSDGDGRSTILSRHCTTDYKIRAIEKEARRLMGYAPRQRIKKRGRAMIGISLDEVSRMKPSRTHWADNYYPLIEARMTRQGCMSVIRGAGLPEPRKSACVFCPFHSDHFWKNLKMEHPDEWARAVEFDAQIRDLTASGVKNPAYLHRSLEPLEKVDLGENQLDLFDNECSGVCGV